MKAAILSVNSGANATDGSGISLHGENNAQSALVEFRSYGWQNSDPAFLFKHYDVTSSTFKTSVVINKYGLTRLGTAGSITSDKLTVDGSIYLYDPNNNPLSVMTRTDMGSLNLYSGSSDFDGSGISLMGKLSSTNSGKILFTSILYDGSGGFVWRQAAGATLTNRMILDLSGYLHLGGSVDFNLMPAATTPREINANTTLGLLALHSNYNTTDGTSIELFGSASAITPGEIRMVANGTTGNAFTFNKFSGSTTTQLVTIQKNGKVLIGDPATVSTASNSYLLFVEKGILAERVRVALKTGIDWADYVFDEEYKLMPLSDVASYIEKHKHLPDVPSASEAVANGVDLGQMDATLLKKVEELTLYVIDLQKTVNLQQEEIRKLKKGKRQ